MSQMLSHRERSVLEFGSQWLPVTKDDGEKRNSEGETLKWSSIWEVTDFNFDLCSLIDHDLTCEPAWWLGQFANEPELLVILPNWTSVPIIDSKILTEYNLDFVRGVM